jgi:hypothetical protein
MFWIIGFAIGCVLIITGTIPVGRGSNMVMFRPPYGRIFGAAIILYLVWSLTKSWGGGNPTLTIIFSSLLILIGLACMILSLNEKVR